MGEIRLQVSNDVFQYFYKGEEPLDEASWEEIEELQEEFPGGCAVLDNWQYLEDEPGMVEATFVSTIPEEGPEEVDAESAFEAWDMYLELFNGWRLVLLWLQPGVTARIAFWHPHKGRFGEQEVQIQSTGKLDYFSTKGPSRYFLKSFKPIT